MVRSIELSEASRMEIVKAYASGKGYKKISKQFEISPSTIRKIIYKWKTSKTTANRPRSGRPSKFSASADCKMLRELSKNPKMSSRDLQEALAAVDVKVHASTIRKRLHKFEYAWETCEKQSLSAKEAQPGKPEEHPAQGSPPESSRATSSSPPVSE